MKLSDLRKKFIFYCAAQLPNDKMGIVCEVPFSKMIMKQTKKLDKVNQKIAELTEKKKALENQMIESISKHIAALLIKKHASEINMKSFLKKIEQIIDEEMKQ